jgi:hypothetical protein
MAAMTVEHLPAFYPPDGCRPVTSPVADLIRSHRAEMRVIWDRHAQELQRAQQGVRAA